MLSQKLNKPYYLFHPRLAIRRTVSRLWPHHPGDATVVDLPWGLSLPVARTEVIGQRLARRGVFDLPLTEAIHRLVDPGDLVVDVGANIGYVSGLAAVRAGPAGSVYAIEPHPAIRAELESNVERWQRQRTMAPIRVRPDAVSDRRGTSSLADPDLETNRGSAALASGAGEGTGHRVSTLPLDELFEDREIGLLKVDVEGHELEVFRGARQLLSQRRIRDVIFEESRPGYPTPVTRLLTEHGYSLFRLGHTLLRPALVRNGAPVPLSHGDELNYLATTAPERAQQRLRKRGWRALRAGR